MRNDTKGLLYLLGVIASIPLVCFAAWGFREIGSWASREESTWPDSAEFSTIETGADRFSEHETNLEGVVVLVDHETGVQYAMSAGGLCPLLDVDGSPLRVREASDDGE